MHASRRPWEKYPRKENKYIFLNDNFFLKTKNNIIDTKKPPIGEKNNEWEKCLWKSTDSKGSDEDLINISRSGDRPPKKPHMAADFRFFFLLNEPARQQPSKPCETGSIIY